jgi:hypothetical protein
MTQVMSHDQASPKGICPYSSIFGPLWKDLMGQIWNVWNGSGFRCFLLGHRMIVYIRCGGLLSVSCLAGA